jgi:hypothetical protein
MHHIVVIQLTRPEKKGLLEASRRERWKMEPQAQTKR